jgi:cation:H+ antiporter
VTALALIAGLVLLVVGGETLVRGGSSVGRRLGMSPLVVGLTIVAAATSAPELAVSVDASLRGAPGVAVGNVVGSNITNVLLVLGVAAVILPVAVGRQLVRLDVPVMAVISVLLLVLALDRSVGRLDGVGLMIVLVVYLIWSLRAGGNPGGSEEPEAAGARSDTARGGVGRDVVLIVVGVAMLVLGARLLVDAATTLAEAVGLSDLVIGLTVVAVGTSLPEVATSVIAALRRHPEIAIGNVVGSCIFNIGMVMGLTAVVAPGSGVPVDPAAVNFDLPVMVATAVALLVVAETSRMVSRWEAVLFVATSPPTSPTCCWTPATTTLCPASAR